MQANTNSQWTIELLEIGICDLEFPMQFRIINQLTLLPGMDGIALVYCEGAFNTTNGKTAHGLVRFTNRYKVAGVIDSRYSGMDAGMVLDNKEKGIPVFSDISKAMKSLSSGFKPTHLVIGLAPDGGRLPGSARDDIKKAITLGLNVDCGLHDYLTEDKEINSLALSRKVKIRDIRKTPHINDQHFFTGNIGKVKSLKIAILGTDSAVGKRTTAWLLVHGLQAAGFKAELVGTGQTAWMQGAKYSIILDSVIADFMAGEIEHAVYSAWENEKPDVIVIEGQGSLMNPAYPGGYEILAAGRPDLVILQHAPARTEYDGFPGFLIQPINHQIQAIEIVSGKKVLAITINHEHIKQEDIPYEAQKLTEETGLPAMDILLHGSDELVKLLKPYIRVYS
jgi:uncharacterized NAD-dependent epimerase/dehydratase family protein